MLNLLLFSVAAWLGCGIKMSLIMVYFKVPPLQAAEGQYNLYECFQIRTGITLCLFNKPKIPHMEEGGRWIEQLSAALSTVDFQHTFLD